MNWLGPLPGSREARALSWMAITVAFIVCALSIVRGFQGQTFMGRPLGGDFVQFYVAGKILNQGEPARIYDLDLEVRLQHESVAGLPKDQMLVFAGAPFVANLFRPFAWLLYPWAYVAWLAFSLGLYATAVSLLLQSIDLSGEQRKTGFLLAISSMPFLMETWIGGQVSVLAFFAISLFVYCRAKGWKYLAGLALALALFKPTLIAIPVLMLVCGRRWRMLAGVGTGATALALGSFLTAGVQGCLTWLETLKFYGRLATGPAAAFRRNKYVDLGSFCHLLLGNWSGLAQILATLVTIAGIAILAAAWWKSSNWDRGSRDLLWAATFSGALVCNVYSPIYDVILIVPAVALAANAIPKPLTADREKFAGWLVLLYMVPWLTQSFAEFLRIQPFTLVLAGFAWWSLALAKRWQGPQAKTQTTDLIVDSPFLTREVSHRVFQRTLRSISYDAYCRTRNSGHWLSVLLRSFHPLPALLWERDR